MQGEHIMQSREFIIGTIGHVKNFIEVTEKFIEDIDLVRGRYIIDGKSIMGILSLDLSKPVEVRIHTTDLAQGDKFFKAVEEALRG